MLQRASPAPRGPRNASPNVRGRGGIQKRKAGPTRVDKDGDLVMDPTATADKRRAARSQLGGSGSTRGKGAGRTNGGPSSRGGTAGMIKAQQAIIRGLSSKDSQANVLESRITTKGTRLQIGGFFSSKAATNPDGGIESLLAFLERKATGVDTNPVKIKKVCYRFGHGVMEVLVQSTLKRPITCQSSTGRGFLDIFAFSAP